MRRIYTVTFVASAILLIGCNLRDDDEPQRPNPVPQHSSTSTTGQAPDSALHKKRIEYRDAMQELVQDLQVRYQQGSDNIDNLLAAKLALSDAELALTSTKRKRMEVLEASLQTLQEIEEYQRVRISVGHGSKDEFEKAKAARIYGEILILEETDKDD